jgi:hypothetical protein
MNQTVLEYNNFGFTRLRESDLSFFKFCHRKVLTSLSYLILI